MNTWQRRSGILAGILAASYLAACGYVWVMQDEKIFDPRPTLQFTPATQGMAFEEVGIPVGRGREQGKLHGFWVPADTANAPAFLYLHGQSANIGTNLERTKRLHQLGYHVLLIDYRGFGYSLGGGRPSETKVYEDAEAAWNYLTQVRGVKPREAFIYGHSLGGAIAIELATHHPEAAGLIAESTFTSMPAMAKRNYWYLPTDFLLRHRFESLQKIGTLKVPVLFIHGTGDKKIPFEMTEQLYAAAPEPKQRLLIEGGEHANSGSIGWGEYQKTITAFVQAQQKRAQ
jgi:pimeloyl-ACP methyl ester carboxylesterase